MKASRIITFEGTSAISAAIGVLTGSNQSHVAWQTPDGKLWEAVDSGFEVTPSQGEDRIAPLYRFHPKGTSVHFFEYHAWCSLSQTAEAKALEFLQSVHKQPYGFRTLFSFMLYPGKDPEPKEVICSEAVLGASIAAGRPLVDRCRPWNCSPKDIFQSPLLEWKGSHKL